jgi:hypothetical protein
MYPNNQNIEIFGEQVSRPGVDEHGKFTNGSFSDPMVKPSFIPAESINLILDNLSELIKKCGRAPDSVTVTRLAALLASAANPKSIMMRDAGGRAKVAKPVEDDDIARKIDVRQAVGERGSQAQVELSKMSFIADSPAAASTANVNVQSGGLPVIDGVQTAVGDLVFLKDQVEKNENGFWEAQTGAWNRYAGYTGAEADKECFTNKLITVEAGAMNAGKIFFLDGALFTIGTDSLVFIESPFACESKPGKIAIRDREGKIKDLSGVLSGGDNMAEQVDGYGRNLLEVFKVGTIPEAMAEIRRRCNNNGEIDGSGIPDFRGIMIGDYIDALDLSAIPAENGGTAGQEWNDTYKNNRIVVSGFNTYKGAGDTENAKNHILFTFRNIPLRKRMNASNDNAGGYAASEVRAFLEGTAGNGTGDKSGVTTAAFMNALKAQIGDYLYTIRKAHSTKSGQAWNNYTVFLLSELEAFGYPCYGDEGVYMAAITTPAIAARAGWLTNIHIPIFQKSYEYLIKRYNGARDWWYLQTHYAAAASSFCDVHNYGNTSANLAGYVSGCAPDSVRRYTVGRLRPLRPTQKEKTSCG